MDFRTMTGRELEEYMIGSIIGTEEVAPEEEQEAEASEEDEYERGPGRRAALKMFFVRSSVSPEEIDSMLVRASYENSKAKKFLSTFKVYTIKKERNYSVLILHWREMERDLVFLIKESDSCWEILTVERMEHVRRSLSRLLEFSTEIGALWLERHSLDERVRKIIASDSINGFIAKRRTAGSRRRVTIRVYGGSMRDLATARTEFETEPTTIYFSKHSSPDAAIVGSVAADPGYLFIERVVPDARGIFDEIHDGIRMQFVSEYTSRFGLEDTRKTSVSANDDGSVAAMIPELRVVSLDFPSGKKWDTEGLQSVIQELLLDGTVRGQSRYIGYKWVGYDSYMIHDGNLGGGVHLRLEPENRRILLSSVDASSPRLIGDLAEFIISRVEHSLSISVFKEGATPGVPG